MKERCKIYIAGVLVGETEIETDNDFGAKAEAWFSQTKHETFAGKPAITITQKQVQKQVFSAFDLQNIEIAEIETPTA